VSVKLYSRLCQLRFSCTDFFSSSKVSSVAFMHSQKSLTSLMRPPGIGHLSDRIGPQTPTPRRSTFLCLVCSYGPTVPRHACILLLPNGVFRRISFDHAEYPGHLISIFLDFGSPRQDTVSESAVLRSALVISKGDRSLSVTTRKNTKGVGTEWAVLIY
jgi:hypothetical protein